MKGFRNDSLSIFGALISIVRGSREMKGFRNDSLNIF